MRQAKEDRESFKAFLKWEKQMQYDFRVAWSVTCTLSEFREEFEENDYGDFEWKGIGWYSKKGDTMLAQATEDPERFLFMVWYDNDPREAMKACLSLPQHHLPTSV